MMEKEIMLIAVGDIMLGDHPVRLGNGVRSTIEKLGTSQLFSNVKDQFSDADIVFGNLEVVLSDIVREYNL
ncbi:MAG: CapA family protein [Nitrospirota bacterium]